MVRQGMLVEYRNIMSVARIKQCVIIGSIWPETYATTCVCSNYITFIICIDSLTKVTKSVWSFCILHLDGSFRTCMCLSSRIKKSCRTIKIHIFYDCDIIYLDSFFNTNLLCSGHFDWTMNINERNTKRMNKTKQLEYVNFLVNLNDTSEKWDFDESLFTTHLKIFLRTFSNNTNEEKKKYNWGLEVFYKYAPSVVMR